MQFNQNNHLISTDGFELHVTRYDINNSTLTVPLPTECSLSQFMAIVERTVNMDNDLYKMVAETQRTTEGSD